VVELGRAARSQASLKVRQPLAEVLVQLPDAADRAAVEKLADQIRDELNVKSVRLVANPAELFTSIVKGRPQLLGPKHGRDLPRVLAALGAADPEQVARAVRAGQTVEVDGFALAPEEVEVMVTPRPGLSVATAGALSVAVTMVVTPELVQEGLARELVHRIQTMRRAADFRIDDRIATYYDAPEPLREVFDRYAGYIRGETLSRELRPGTGPDDAYRERVNLDGAHLTLAVVRADGGDA
jgi:isoleucyl-tRNA synthetase